MVLRFIINVLMILVLVLSLPACKTGTIKDDNTLKSEKDEIIRKVKVFLDNEEPENIRSLYEILNKMNFQNRRIKMILTGLLCASYPGRYWFSLKVLAEGLWFEAWFESGVWKDLKIKAVETPTPVPPSAIGAGGSYEPIGDTTQGTLILSYTDVNGKPVEIKRIIEIDNRTRVISHEGSTVTMLKQIFEPLPSPLGQETITLLMDFDYGVTISFATQ